MYMIQHIESGKFVFGNKSLCERVSLARKFETESEAESHIAHWFDPTLYRKIRF